MRQGQQSRRGRNRGGRKPQNSISRNYESSGPDVKIRGTAMHIAEKYTSLARDAMASGDSVAAENYLQHAEHYNRIILAAQAQNPGGEQPVNGGPGRFGAQDAYSRDFDSDDDDDGEDFAPQQQRFQPLERNERAERPERNERPERVERPERAPRPERMERPERVERAERPERVPAYNQHQQPQPYIPQNAFPQFLQQPVVLPPQSNVGDEGAPQPVNGVANGEAYNGAPEGDPLPRRRRRRPIGEAAPVKTYTGRSGAAALSNAAPAIAATIDPKTDE
ncbi:DUF4167 domain-containing protein [Rhodomicrobium vannielii ATCC 17100]|uniref:DUF4167 domain-containing protein n=1 Tax=Rhodomicrobium vannielii TaxID=1069 RepID=UPI001919476C|nr:DUF4167 domain-containing protein [Rhodomicrobium vannielii]MBJ7535811.1 DUF4167 domain-containing protein [Rhodomicrobium vannielii ATCC 17100]